MDNRNERATEALRHAAAEFLSREAGPQSLITVTAARVSSDFSHATIYFTVLPDTAEAAALGLANRHVEDLKAFLKTRAKLPRTPHIDFAIDLGEKSRQRLDEISQ